MGRPASSGVESSLSPSVKIMRSLRNPGFNAKRRPGEEVGVESWYSYYAGYTEEFVHAAITAADIPRGSKVLDPWNGCGTTTKVADSLGYSAIGIDINPVATLVASAKLARSGDELYVLGLASRLVKISMSERTRVKKNDPLRGWLCPAVIRIYRSIERGILEDLTIRNGEILNPARHALPPLASFLLLALLRSAREFAGIKKTSNPTWLRQSGYAPKHKPEKFASRWMSNLRKMGEDLLDVEEKPLATGTQIFLGDSRTLPIIDNSVDLIVTSPPYCTRIDYVVSTSFELAALGIGNDQNEYDILRRKSMGTPLSRKEWSVPCLEDFPPGVANVLERVKCHPSKSSKNYYFKNYAQYFYDSMASVKEIERVLKPGGVAALVVQSSYYKEIYVDLPKLYVEMAESLSMEASVAVEYDVSRFLAQINSRSIAHRKQTSHSEAVVIMEAK